MPPDAAQPAPGGVFISQANWALLIGREVAFRQRSAKADACLAAMKATAPK